MLLRFLGFVLGSSAFSCTIALIAATQQPLPFTSSWGFFPNIQCSNRMAWHLLCLLILLPVGFAQQNGTAADGKTTSNPGSSSRTSALLLVLRTPLSLCLCFRRMIAALHLMVTGKAGLLLGGLWVCTCCCSAIGR